jgi:hypothetical protein
VVIRRAVARGDDCHARTAAANEELVAGIDALDSDVAAVLRAIPAFVLPSLMAGAAAALRHHHSAIEAMGGNGIDFGVRRRGESEWRQLPAQAPQGERFPGHAAAVPLPAVGDSVLIDYCGLGGLAHAPELQRSLLHPNSGIVDSVRIASGAAVPMFNLAILDAAGAAGLIGRGVYSPPPALFDDDAW